MELFSLNKFKHLAILDKEIFGNFLNKYPPKISELSFTNLFAWRHAKQYMYAIVENHLIIAFFDKETNRIKFLQPIGPNPSKMIESILLGNPDLSFDRVEKEIAVKMKNHRTEIQRDMFDYVYDVSDLIQLKGSKFQAKRNLINRFSAYSPEVSTLNKETVKSFLDLQEKWCSIRGCDLNESMKDEDLAIKEALLNYESLNMQGVCVKIGGKVEGFALGEPLNENTFVEHFEKANTDFVGIYQYLLFELCKIIPQKYQLLNREQDLGLDGLRKAKSSYNPSFMVEKFKVSA